MFSLDSFITIVPKLDSVHIKSWNSDRGDEKESYFKAFIITYFVNPINHHSAPVSKGFILEYHCILIIESTATIDDHCALVHFVIELMRAQFTYF